MSIISVRPAVCFIVCTCRLYETCDVAWSRSRHDHLHETALDVSATAHGHRSVPKVDHLGTGLPGLPL